MMAEDWFAPWIAMLHKTIQTAQKNPNGLKHPRMAAVLARMACTYHLGALLPVFVAKDFVVVVLPPLQHLLSR